ncbi:hypothetical protein B0H16DRAFT_1324994 [Mycena metata]|uniref:Gag-like protein n=1 Tax=Mycena metata TaxID=1033252 RepID=A0AAD7IBJ0_9AGAR|nr:hypothetical protein B0H16DRAFT_1324994 [Mycena metata]
MGRVVLAGGVRQVSRVFPHLKPVQCWGCYRYGHTRARCRETLASCGGCGGAFHGIVCAETLTCVNCGGAHRADNPVCPRRKEIAEGLRQRAADLCRALDENSSYLPPSNRSPSLSPLSPSISLSTFTTDHTAPRLPERK